MSDTMWRNLERGYETRKGVRFPIAPRANTVANAARVVGLNLDEALNLAGLSLRDLEDDPAPDPELASVSDERLIEEVRRRITVASTHAAPPRHQVESDPERYAAVNTPTRGENTNE